MSVPSREFNSAGLLAEVKRETLANIAPDMLQTLRWISARIDSASGSPSFTANEHGRIAMLVDKAAALT